MPSAPAPSCSPQAPPVLEVEELDLRGGKPATFSQTTAWLSDLVPPSGAVPRTMLNRGNDSSVARKAVASQEIMFCSLVVVCIWLNTNSATNTEVQHTGIEFEVYLQQESAFCIPKHNRYLKARSLRLIAIKELLN